MYCLSRDKCLIVYSADYYVSNEKKYIYPSKFQPKIYKQAQELHLKFFYCKLLIFYSLETVYHSKAFVISIILFIQMIK